MLAHVIVLKFDFVEYLLPVLAVSPWTYQVIALYSSKKMSKNRIYIIIETSIQWNNVRFIILTTVYNQKTLYSLLIFSSTLKTDWYLFFLAGTSTGRWY